LKKLRNWYITNLTHPMVVGIMGGREVMVRALGVNWQNNVLLGEYYPTPTKTVTELYRLGDPDKVWVSSNDAAQSIQKIVEVSFNV